MVGLPQVRTFIPVFYTAKKGNVYYCMLVHVVCMPRNVRSVADLPVPVVSVQSAGGRGGGRRGSEKETLIQQYV